MYSLTWRIKTWRIKHRWTGAVLYASGGESLRDAVVTAARSGADLRGAYLTGAYLTGAYLTGADLRGADLTAALLTGAYLRGADLTGADLRGAYLTRAYLRGADLTGADLRGADLTGAYLRGADLTRAYLRGADLTGADLTGAKIGNSALVGARPILQIGPIGSRSDYLVSYITKASVMIRAGCFFGTLDEFRAAVSGTHGDTVHAREYAAAIVMVEAHAALWPDDTEPKE